MADLSWRRRPATMAAPVWRAAAGRIGEHARDHGLDRVRVILHGGEPLLAGLDRLLSIVADVRRAVSGVCAAEFCVQTNGVLLCPRTLAALADEDIWIGMSLDGEPADNDRRRRYADGRGSAAAVSDALELLTQPRYRPVFAGLLCTIDLDASPVPTYEALLRHAPPALDFLLPHANWTNRPRRRPGDSDSAYGEWLAAIFDRWYDAPRQETRIRLFEDIVSLLLGGSGRSEQVGLSPVGVVVVESDGAIEQVDSLKSTYEGACETGLNVFDHPLDDGLRHPGVVARQIGIAALSAQCLRCPLHRVCGGGHYAHRYHEDHGFRNPSAYCADLAHLIRHVWRRVADDLVSRAPERVS
jgi:uncharacterized protein